MTVGPSPSPTAVSGLHGSCRPTNRIRVMIGTLRAGLIFGWVTVHDYALADEPRDANPPSAAISSPPERYLMLINGQIIKGTVSEEGKDFVVGQRFGPRCGSQKARLRGHFDSMRVKPYQFQVQPNFLERGELRRADEAGSVVLKHEASRRGQGTAQESPRAQFQASAGVGDALHHGAGRGSRGACSRAIPKSNRRVPSRWLTITRAASRLGCDSEGPARRLNITGIAGDFRPSHAPGDPAGPRSLSPYRSRWQSLAASVLCQVSRRQL